MPEIIVTLATIACFIASICYLGDEPYNNDKSTNIRIGVYFMLMFGALVAWEIIAQINHEIKSETTYEIITVGGDPTNVRQIAVTKNYVVNVTERTGKIADEEKCRLLAAKYETFSYGILILYSNKINYSIVCPEIEQ